jgi:hypothetical protein
MSARSGWAVPRGQSAELNRDEYSRPAFKERAEAYKIHKEMGTLGVEEIRTMERFSGDAPDLQEQPQQDNPAPTALTGGEV